MSPLYQTGHPDVTQGILELFTVHVTLEVPCLLNHSGPPIILYFVVCSTWKMPSNFRPPITYILLLTYVVDLADLACFYIPSYPLTHKSYINMFQLITYCPSESGVPESLSVLGVLYFHDEHRDASSLAILTCNFSLISSGLHI